MKKIKTISLFSGIGAYEKAAENLKIPIEILHYCEINKFAATAFSAIHNVPEEKNLGDISLVDIKKLPKCDLVTYSFPCFVAGTLVLTDKGYKKIEDIKIGDNVLTHTNTYKKVILPMEKYTNEILKISSMSSEDLLVTEEHPFYVREKYREWINEKRTSERKFKNPEWIIAKNLNKNHYLGIAINQESKLPIWNGITINYSDNRRNRHKNILSEKFKFEEFWWLIGRYIGDGWIRQQGGIIICCDRKETNDITSKLDILEFNYNIVKERTCNKIHIPFKEISLFVEQFGKGASNKKLTNTIFDLPKKELKSFLDGYISADGSKKGKWYSITTTSKELTYGIGQCIAKVYNRPYSVTFVKRPKKYMIEGREVNQKDTYKISFKIENDKQDKAFYENGYIWCPINSISKEQYNGMVYNMEVEDDNSYTVNNIIVHNCQSISCAGRREGIIKGKTKSGLVYEALDIIEVSEPKIAIMENVKNLVGKKFINDFKELLKILDEMGYNNYWKVLNSKDYNLPQNRERVFLISIKKEIDKGFEFPNTVPLTIKAIDLINKEDENVYWVNENSDISVYNSLLEKNPNNVEGVSKSPKTREFHNFKEISDCLLAHDATTKNLVQFINKDGQRVFRRMTPTESFKFMGFEEKDYLVAKKRLEEKYYNGKPRSDSQIYRMAGNSIAVNCIQAIMEELQKNNYL